MIKVGEDEYDEEVVKAYLDETKITMEQLVGDGDDTRWFTQLAQSWLTMFNQGWQAAKTYYEVGI